MHFVDSLTGRMKSKPVDADGSDEASIESSSVYTASIKNGCKLLPVAESENEDRSGSNDDDISRGSTIDTRKSIQSRLLNFKRNPKEALYSADGESLTGSFADYEDYDMTDIEKQLQNINVSKPSTKLIATKQKKRYGDDPLEQAPASSSSRNHNGTETDGKGDVFCISKESAIKFRCTILLVFMSCIFFLISAGLILASYRKESLTEGPNESPDQASNPAVINATPTASPTTKIASFQSKESVVPGLENSVFRSIDQPTEDECIDDMTGLFYVGPDFQDCAYLASHPASQMMFCSPEYDEIYELCKKTCKKC